MQVLSSCVTTHKNLDKSLKSGFKLSVVQLCLAQHYADSSGAMTRGCTWKSAQVHKFVALYHKSDYSFKAKLSS